MSQRYAGVRRNRAGTADAVDFAARARAKRLALFHHDPAHDDGALDLMRVAATDRWIAAGGDRSGLSLAAEGTSVVL
ncbi:MAG: hypothetical protein M3459_10370 [Actinomycetota bacterium]|nr:hypothetical protein [Actinomycetota bacterium]